MQDHEALIPLAEARHFWPGAPHASTLWRACRYGVRASNGRRVRLEHARYGRRVYTSPAAIERFGRRLADADAAHFGRPAADAASPQSPREVPRGAPRGAPVSFDRLGAVRRSGPTQ